MHINNLKVGLLFLFFITLSRCGSCGGSLDPSARQHEPLNSSDLDSHRTPIGTKTLFQASEQIANNLTAAQNLQNKYQSLKNQVSTHPGNNQDPAFAGIQGMKDALRSQPAASGDLNKFKRWAQAGEWKNFHTYHYDWWMFPIDRSSSGQGMRYTVYQDDIQQLKADSAWLKDYRLGAVLLMQSWGWDVANRKMYTALSPDQKWQNWDVRLGKLGHSLILFEQWDLYAGVEAYVQYLTQSGVKLDKWVLKYFPTYRS
jgi:hypothetical protein